MVASSSLFSPQELHRRLANEKKQKYSILKTKTQLKEIIKRICIGNYEDSRNMLLLNSNHITHIILIRFTKEDYITRINFPHNFEYYIIELNNEYNFTQFSHFKFLLDEILFEKEENKIFIHSYRSVKSILAMLTFYIVTTMNYQMEEAINYIKMVVSDFDLSVEEADQIYYFTKRHQLTYFPGEFTTYSDIADT